MGPFAELRAGRIQEFFIVPRDGGAYSLPVKGADWSLRLRGREPGRYDADRATRDAVAEFEAAEAFDSTVHVQYVEPEFGRSGMAYIEGYAKSPVLVRVTAFVRIGALGMPGGIMNLLVQNEVLPEQVQRLAEGDEAPVGRVRLVPVHPPED
ncbi:hypothetical protein [Microbacterium sp. CH-015]|uniref:hypothetical protein n=1 Tax=Microbacterium sp. CH-015 TaxID=3406734 RepID=UPI003C76DD62